MTRLYKPFFTAILLFATVFSFAQKLPTVLTPTITCDSVLQTSTCAGGNVIVAFKVTGGSYNVGNVFTAQLSNNGGAFTTPVNIGSIPLNLGFILATIPANTNFGLYKVRVITSNPKDTSNPSPNYIFVTQIAQLNQVVATPHNYICPGDSITLTAVNIASKYAWSTGATTSSIKVTQPAIYSVTTTDALTCSSTAYDTLATSTCTGVEENVWQNAVSISPNPSAGVFNVQMNEYANVQMKIYNMIGDCVQQQICSPSQRQIDISSRPSGVYFLKITKQDGSSLVKKVIRE